MTTTSGSMFCIKFTVPNGNEYTLVSRIQILNINAERFMRRDAVPANGSRSLSANRHFPYVASIHLDDDIQDTYQKESCFFPYITIIGVFR